MNTALLIILLAVAAVAGFVGGFLALWFIIEQELHRRRR